MKISIFGLGYVGAVTAGCLSKHGHTVVGVDVSPQKVESFNQGIAPIVEPGLDELLKTASQKGLLRATESCDEAIAATDVSIICVGTPSALSGALDLTFVRGVIRQIGNSLRQTRKPHVLVIRSTMLPGSTAAIVGELLADLQTNGLVSVFYFPEFLRESTAVADFENPSLVVVGTRDGSKPPKDLMTGLFGESAQIVNWPTAEMVKYACNAFHATKIVFANEMGRVGKELQIDSQVVMSLLCSDTKLNLSRYYLKPGNPFGGSCLPKDLRAVTHHSRQHGIHVPMLESLLLSNERHLQALLSLITQSNQSEIVILGLSFKPNTDDLRESAMVEVAQIILGRGYRLRIYDPALNLASLVGSNKRLIDTRMPHLASVLHQDLKSAMGDKGLVLAAQKCATIEQLSRVLTPAHYVVDINGWPELRTLASRYEGFCW